jgi:hypothetical protein
MSHSFSQYTHLARSQTNNPAGTCNSRISIHMSRTRSRCSSTRVWAFEVSTTAGCPARTHARSIRAWRARTWTSAISSSAAATGRFLRHGGRSSGTIRGAGGELLCGEREFLSGSRRAMPDAYGDMMRRIYRSAVGELPEKNPPPLSSVPSTTLGRGWTWRRALRRAARDGSIAWLELEGWNDSLGLNPIRLGPFIGPGPSTFFFLTSAKIPTGM